VTARRMVGACSHASSGRCPDRKVGWRPIHRQSVPEQVLEAWEKLIIDLASQAEAAIEPIVLRLSAQAKHLWDAWREELEPRLRRELGDLSTIVEWAAKLPGRRSVSPGTSMHFGRVALAEPSTPRQ